MQRFFTVRIDYYGQAEHEDQEDPRYTTIILYQSRLDLEKVASLEERDEAIVKDIRKNVPGIKDSDTITIAEEITDPVALRIFKFWNHRSIDLEACLFDEGSVYESERSDRSGSGGED